MSEFDTKKDPFDDDSIIFDLKDRVTSGEFVRTTETGTEPDVLELEQPGDEDAGEILSPVFKELASIELPRLPRENRARLQMQTPSRLFFYWSVRDNPFQTLRRAFGDMGSYTLVAKLIDLTRDTETIYPIEAEGTLWFDVDSNRQYRAEIGFYAPNRPYIRVMFSNTVVTPRKRPSPRAATSADWNVTAPSFSRVLDVSGFTRDAFEVALVEDLPEIQPASYAAFSELVGHDDSDFAGIASDELRHAMLLIASGLSLEHLRYRIDASLFALLQENAAKLSSENAAASLKEHFGIDTEDVEEEEVPTTVTGASLVNFPRRVKRKRAPSGYNPISSFVNR